MQGAEERRLRRMEQYAASLGHESFDFAQGREPVERQMMP
jgi:hypothetical protein